MRSLRLTAAAAACLLIVGCGLTESLDGYGGGIHDPKDASTDQGQAGTSGDALPPDTGGAGGGAGGDASVEDADASLDAPDDGDAQDAGDSSDDAGDAEDSGEDGAADAEGGLDGAPCNAQQKLCGEDCVELDDPAYGCGPTDCTPCSAPPHMSALCEGTTCAAGTCSQGWADCNDSTSDGCEIETSSDPDNCGGCGDACSGYHVPTRICTNGECVGTCGSHFEDCNDDLLTDGCETDINADTDHCGECGRACSTAHVVGALSCTSGVCDTSNCAGGWSNITLPSAPEQDDGCEHQN